LPYLRPDGKTQVTVAYRRTTVGIDTILISTQHTSIGDITEQAVQAKIKDLWSAVVQPVFDDNIQPDDQTHWSTPPANLSSVVPRETLGTGRKIIVDTLVVTRGMEVGHFLVKTRRR